MSGFDAGRLKGLHDVMAGHVEQDRVGGVAWLAARGDDVEVGAAGYLTRGEPNPVRRDSIFRIASMTKPIVAVGALLLVEECALRLADPVDALLPELADRRVLVDGRGPIEGDTVPAHRPITVHDVLTFRLGLGMDFEAPWPQPLLDAMGELGLGSGPPEPQVPPAPDEWMRRLSTLPLLYQPGERWLYNTGSDVLGVLIARAAGQPLGEFLRTRIFEPLGMVDTGFSTDHRRASRLLLHDRPRDRRAKRVRRARRPVGDATRVSIGRGRSRVHARRRARLWPDAVVRRALARRLAAACLARRSTR